MLESYADDTDYDGDKMISEIVIFTALTEGNIIGFVQYGKLNFTYYENEVHI